MIDQHDSNWWQAYREGEQEQSLAGLMPSANFQMQYVLRIERAFDLFASKCCIINQFAAVSILFLFCFYSHCCARPKCAACAIRREAINKTILTDSNNTAALNYKNNQRNKKSSKSMNLLNCGKRSQPRRKKRKSQRNYALLFTVRQLITPWLLTYAPLTTFLNQFMQLMKKY